MSYMKTREVADILKIHINTVRARVLEMREFIGTEYPPTALIADDGITRIDFNAFCDFLNRRGELLNHDR